MAEIDALSIEISATTTKASTAIDNLCKKLGNLNTALNLKFGDTLTTNLNGLAGSLDNVSRSINGFDADKLKNISRSLKSLSQLSKSTNDVAKDIAKDTSAVQKASNNFADVLKDMFNVDEAGMTELRSKLSEFASQIESGVDTSAIENDIKRVITDNLELTESLQTVAAGFREVRDLMNSQNMHIPEGMSKEFGDDWNRVRATLGIRGTSRQGTTQPHELAELLNGRFGAGIDITGNEADTVQQIYEWLVKSRDALQSLAQQEFEARGGAEEISRAIDGIRANLQEISAQPIQNIVPQETVSSLSEVISNLQTLSGMNISAENMGGVEVLANSMGRLGGEASGRAAQSLTYVAQGLRDLSGIQIPQFGAELETLAAGLGKLGSVRVERAANLSFVAQGLRELQSIGDIPQINGLNELAASLSAFGRKTATQAVTTIPQLATAFRGLIQTLSTAPTVSRNTIDLANALANLAAQGGKAGSAVSALSPRLRLFSSNAQRATKHTNGLAATIGKIYATYWLLFRAFSKLGDSIEYASDLVEVQNVVDTVFGDAKSKVEDFADSSIMAFGMTELTAKQFASRFQSMGTAMGITNEQAAASTEFLNEALKNSKRDLDGVDDAYKDLGNTFADVSINLTKLAADMGSFYNMDYDAVAEDLEAVFTGQTRPLRTYGLDLTQATLQEWALKNGLDADIKSMTQAQKTMLRYQYVMAQMGHVMNDYALTADTWANVTRTIGQQFQKLGSLIGNGFINAFRPMLVKFRDFMNTLIDLVEKGMNAIGKLLGWQIEISDVGLADDAEYASDLADGLGDAAGNAKELNKQLAGFDKLNNLTTPSDSGSGSGSGGASGGGGGSANRAITPTVTYKDYESDIETWGQLGEAIADKLSDAMESIPWDEIYAKADSFGADLADFMNGLFTGEEGERLFENLGATIAGAVNTVFIAWRSWANKFNFKGLGKAVGTGINSFFKTWKPKIAARAFYKTASGILDAIIAALDTVKWDKVGTQIGKFLAGLKWDRLMKKSLTAIGKIISALFETIKFSFKEAPFETSLLLAFGALKLTGLAKKIPALLATKLFGAAGLVKLAVQSVKIRILDVVAAVASGVSPLKAIASALSGVGGSILSAITSPAGIAISVAVILTFAIAKIVDDLTVTETEIRDALGGDAWDDVTDMIEGTADAIDDVRQSAIDLEKDYKESLKSIDGEGRQLESLAKQYETLSSKTKLTKKEKQQLKNVSRKLVDELPDLNDRYDEISGTLSVTSDELKELIDNEIEYRKQVAAGEYLESLYQKRYEAIDLLRQAYDEYKTAADNAKTKSVELHTALENGELSVKEYEEISAALSGSVKDAAQNMQDAKDNADGFGASINNMTDDLYGYTENFDSMADAFGGFGSDALEANLAISGLDDNLDSLDNKWKSRQKNIDTTKSSVDKFGKSVDKSKNSVSKLEQQSKTSFSNTSKSAKRDAGNAATSIDSLSTSLKNAKKESDLSGASTNINKFSTKASKDAKNATNNVDALNGSLQSTKRKSDLSKASSNIDTFKKNVSSDMGTVKSKTDTARGSINKTKISTNNLMKKSGQTFTIKTDTNPLLSLGDAISTALQGIRDLFGFNNKTVTVNTQTNHKSNKKALGGAFYNNRWHEIAQYASGGRPSVGTAFIAGEAGPEVVGHIGGRTEVLNQSQMASAIYKAVVDGIAPMVAEERRNGQRLDTLNRKKFTIDAERTANAVRSVGIDYQNRTGRSWLPA